MLACLNHPNLPKVSDYFTEHGKHYIVMEFVEGQTLEDYLSRRGGSVSEAEARGWAAQLCDVLGYLHRQQPPVIFRDLKPANVMLTPQGQLKLIDFGIARFFKAGKPGDTLVMGTPGYAAPEQHGQGQTDARSDVYSLGVLLHHLLTGYDPAATPFALPPVRQLNPQVSPAMAQVITRAIEVHPAQRFPTVERVVPGVGEWHSGTGGRPSRAAWAWWWVWPLWPWLRCWPSCSCAVKRPLPLRRVLLRRRRQGRLS
ncbi:MAG: serine/threonine-protein kinase [Anaerolineae bacterium]